MFHHHRFGLAFTAVLGLLATVLLLRQGDEHRLPAGGCIAQLTSLDDARFEQSGEGMRFDGTLLFSDTSLHVEGVLETGSKVFRLNRQILWRESWLSPGRRTLRSNRIYFGDTLPSHIAAPIASTWRAEC